MDWYPMSFKQYPITSSCGLTWWSCADLISVENKSGKKKLILQVGSAVVSHHSPTAHHHH